MTFASVGRWPILLTPTKRASARSCARLAKATSISRGVFAVKTTSARPAMFAAAACASLIISDGLTSTATRAAVGNSSRQWRCRLAAQGSQQGGGARHDDQTHLATNQISGCALPSGGFVRASRLALGQAPHRPARARAHGAHRGFFTCPGPVMAGWSEAEPDIVSCRCDRRVT